MALQGYRSCSRGHPAYSDPGKFLFHRNKLFFHGITLIPETFENCGGSTIRQLTALRAKHAQSEKNWTWGIDGTTGELVRSLQFVQVTSRQCSRWT